MRITARVILAMLAMLWFGHASLASTVVYDNIGPNYSYEGKPGFVVGNAGFPNTYAFAGNFHPSSSGTFDELWLTMYSNYPSDPLTLSLTTDNSGLPGSVLWSETITNQLGTYDTVLNLDHLNGPQLVAGSCYWLTAEGTSTPFHEVTWSFNGIGETSNMAYTENGGPWLIYSVNYATPGMKVGVVPEPSTIILLGIAAISLLAYRRRRQSS
jgi:hypothetical protein